MASAESSVVVVSLPSKGIEDLGQLTSANNEDVEALRRVQELRLPGNSIETLLSTGHLESGLGLTTQQSVLSPFSSLSVLDLSRNRLVSLEGIVALRGTLSTLNVSHNNLTSLEGLERCTELTWIGASHNKLKSLLGLPEVREQDRGQILDAKAKPSALLTIDARSNKLSRILDLLDCPFVLESLVSLNVSENPFTLATQIPAVAERCLRSQVRFIVGGTLQERQLVKGMVGPHVSIESPFDALSPYGGNSTPPGAPSNRSGKSSTGAAGGGPGSGEVAFGSGGHRNLERAGSSASPEKQSPARSSRGQNENSVVVSPPSPSGTAEPPRVSSNGYSSPTLQTQPPLAHGEHQHSDPTDRATAIEHSLALQTYNQMPERELIPQLVLSREENARYEKEAVQLRKRLAEFKRLVAEDMSRMRDMKEEMKHKDRELNKMHDKLQRKSVENDRLKAQLETVRLEAVQKQQIREDFGLNRTEDNAMMRKTQNRAHGSFEEFKRQNSSSYSMRAQSGNSRPSTGSSRHEYHDEEGVFFLQRRGGEDPDEEKEELRSLVAEQQAHIGLLTDEISGMTARMAELLSDRLGAIEEQQHSASDGEDLTESF